MENWPHRLALCHPPSSQMELYTVGKWLWWADNSYGCKSVIRRQGRRLLSCPSFQSISFLRIPPPPPLRSILLHPFFFLYIHVCTLPILILAITRMAAHVRGRFAHSQWMGQYWQHAHCISDQCSGLDSQVWCFHWKEWGGGGWHVGKQCSRGIYANAKCYSQAVGSDNLAAGEDVMSIFSYL